MSKALVTAAALFSLCLSACTMNDSGAHFTGMSAGNDNNSWYCSQPENKNKCIVGGLLLGGIIAGVVISNNNDDHGNGGGGGGGDD